MAKRYGVELSEWRTMSSKDRLLAKQAWLKQRAERVLARKRAQQIRDRRKRYRQLYMEKIGVKKKSKKPEYIPQKSDFPMPGDPDFVGPPIPTLEEIVSDSEFVGPPRSADVEGDPSSAIIADPILSIKYGLLAPPPQLPADASQEQVLFHSKLTELQHETSLSKLEYQYTKKITRLEERRDQVNTDARYKVTDPNTGKTRVMSGWQVRKLYNKQIDRLESGKADVGEAIVEVKTTGGMFRETIRDYPAGSRFVSTPGGMQIQIPQPPAKSAYERVMDEYKTMHPVAAGVRAGAAVLIAGVFNPQTWYDVITGHPERMRESIAEWELGATEEIRSGDIGGYAFRVATSPAYTNIVYPFAAGAGFTAAFKYIGKAGMETAGIVGKTLRFGAKKLPWVAGGTIATVTGADIGMTFAYEQKGMLPEGAGISKVADYALRFALAGYGVKKVLDYRPVVGVRKTPEGVVQFRKFMTTWRGRPVFGYGETYGFAETPGGIARVVSPFPSKPGMIRFETVEAILFGRPKPTVGWEPDLGYRAVGGKPTSIMDIRPVGKPTIYTSQWQNKLFIGTLDKTGTTWQPYTQIPEGYRLTPQPLPKPIIHRAYDIGYVFFVKIPPPIVKLKPQPLVSYKTPKTKGKLFDYNKIFTQQEKTLDELGGQTQQTGQKTIQIQKTQQQTILEQKQLTQQLQESLVVPKQLLKPVLQYEVFQKQQTIPKIRSISAVKSIYAMKNEQAQLFSLSFLPAYETISVQQYQQTYLFETAKLYDTEKVLESLQPQLLVFEQLVGYQTPWPEPTIQKTVFKPTTPTIPPFIPPQLIVPFQPTPKKPRRPTQQPPKTLFGPMKQPVKHQQGYNVFVKDRIYVQGKPVNLSGSFITLNKHSLNKQNALALLGTALDHSAAQTGFIRQTDMPPQPPTTKTTPWKKLQHKFYKKNNFIVEKRSHAIDTPGEIEGISALGWLNRQPQRTKGGVVKKTKTVIEKPAGFIMDDTSTFDMMNQFENMLRRMTHGSK